MESRKGTFQESLKEEGKLKVVFDTNIWISSTLWNESLANKILRKLIETDAEIYTSLEIIEEYKKVLKRDFYYSDEEIDRFVNYILSFSIVLKPSERIFVIQDDPDDNKIIELAVEAKADYIISYDNHLLKIGKFRDILIIRPWELY